MENAMQFNVWEIIVSLVGTFVTGFVGHVHGRIGSHEVRIAKIETLCEAKLGYIEAALGEMNRRMMHQETRIQEICEKVAAK